MKNEEGFPLLGTLGLTTEARYFMSPRKCFNLEWTVTVLYLTVYIQKRWYKGQRRKEGIQKYYIGQEAQVSICLSYFSVYQIAIIDFGARCI